MIQPDINFTSYVPTTLLGLLGLISGYLFFYLKNRNDNKLKEIQSANSKDRIKAIEMSLNELGITIDTSNLNSNQKFELIKNILKTKINRYLITSITAIVIAILIAFLISNSNKSTEKSKETIITDSLPKIDTSNNQTNQVTNIDSGNIQPIPTKNIQDSLDNLASLTDTVQIIKNGPIGVLMFYAYVRFQYSNGKIYFKIEEHNSQPESYHCHLEIELLDKLKNVIEKYKTDPYETKFTPRNADPYWVAFSGEIPSLGKYERLKAKYIKLEIVKE